MHPFAHFEVKKKIQAKYLEENGACDDGNCKRAKFETTLILARL